MRSASARLVVVGCLGLVGQGCVAGPAAPAAEELEQVGEALIRAPTCLCVPQASCPITACIWPSEDCSSLVCPAPEVACHVEADGSSCTMDSGDLAECDGGTCGGCPGCKRETGLCVDGESVDECGTLGMLCADCRDGESCTSDWCHLGMCVHVPEDDKWCDGGSCVEGSCCQGCVHDGRCELGTAANACGKFGTYCMACDDGLVCDGLEFCKEGTCRSGTPPDCFTPNPCIDRRCDEHEGGCVDSPNTGNLCDDGEPCTVGERCQAGRCVSGVARWCDDGNACTEDSCNPETGECRSTSLDDGSGCDDGAVCTGGDSCRRGVCEGDGVRCDDGNPCTRDTLDCETWHCAHDPSVLSATSCVPSNRCILGASCQDGECQGGIVDTCDDYDDCTHDTCDEGTGICSHEPAEPGEACSDGDVCTIDDTCNDHGECRGTPVSCAPSDSCHLPGLCNPDSGVCTSPAKGDGERCGFGSCQQGACIIDFGGFGGHGDGGGAGAEPEGGWAGQAIALGGAVGEGGALGVGALPSAGLGGIAGTGGDAVPVGAGGDAGLSEGRGGSNRGGGATESAHSGGRGSGGGRAAEGGDGTSGDGSAGTTASLEQPSDAGVAGTEPIRFSVSSPVGCNCRVVASRAGGVGAKPTDGLVAGWLLVALLRLRRAGFSPLRRGK